MTTQIKGVLEIDHKRGVMYFHAGPDNEPNLAVVTVLRISRLPAIPKRITDLLDITHMHGVSWER